MNPELEMKTTLNNIRATSGTKCVVALFANEFSVATSSLNTLAPGYFDFSLLPSLSNGVVLPSEVEILIVFLVYIAPHKRALHALGFRPFLQSALHDVTHNRQRSTVFSSELSQNCLSP